MGKMIEIPAHDVLRLLDAKTLAAALLERVSAAAVLGSGIPAIGSIWLDQGGVYAGMVRGRDGNPDYHLIVHGEEISDAKHKKATEWAAGLEYGGFRDFTLPFRHEQAILFGNVGDLFKPLAYWSCERHADSYGFAWYQDFGYGYQGFNNRSSELCARAVRRLTIQPFSN